MRTMRWGTAALGCVAVASVVSASSGCADPGTSGADPLVQKVAQEVSAQPVQDGDGRGSRPASAGDGLRPRVSNNAPVVLGDVSRDPTSFEDFLRFSYLGDPSFVPTMLAATTNVRAFMTATFFFQPSLPLAKAVDYVGGVDNASRNLAVYRCRPPDATALDPVLATWPNVFRVMNQTFGAQFTCPAPAANASVDNQLLCIAREFTDTPQPAVTIGIANTYDVAAQMFKTDALANEVQTKFGIFRAFAGTGYAVKGSGPLTEFTTEESLRNAIAPEYLVKNVDFKTGSCRCILVRPYEGRSNDLVDPDLVWSQGGTDQCREVKRLVPAGAGPSVASSQ